MKRWGFITLIHGQQTLVKGKEKIFVSMPSYKTKQVDEQGKPIYQDVCYPVTKDFREKLYNEIISEYEKAKDKSNEKARESAENHHGNPDKEKDKLHLWERLPAELMKVFTPLL